jgi:Cytochrome c554 and c-prime
MAQACAPAVNSEILQTHTHLAAQRDAYRYDLINAGTAVHFSVTDGTDSLSATLTWAFGLGHKGQTYIYRRDADYYESRLSFYKTLQGLDLTTGHSSTASDDLRSAMGRWLNPGEAQRCFGCHTTASTTANHFDTSQLTPGVTCEACHGPGADHVAAMKAGRIEAGRHAILNPRTFTPVASVDFCGACHRSWSDVMQAGILGVIDARFQPYRLENSRCWRRGDPRLTCVACHNPHEPLAQGAAIYDGKCLACHKTTAEDKTVVANRPGAACPVSTKNCVTCHMPQVEIPSIHAPFTDHDIRIVRTGEPFPE